MATPARLTQIECPGCHALAWVIDNDFRGSALAGGIELNYPERPYPCAGCGRNGPGWAVRQQSPPEFFLQPHPMYPMTHADFDHWVAIVKTHFPGHPLLARLGKTFFPRTPQEAKADKEAYVRAHPVVEMRDQDGVSRSFPDFRHASDWLEVVAPGESLSFLRSDGGRVEVAGLSDGAFSVQCTDGRGLLVAEVAKVDGQVVQEAVHRYIDGDTAGCIGRLRPDQRGILTRLWDGITGR